MKDRRHYGLLVKDEVMLVTPEQADEWLRTRPPAPIMWSRKASVNEKSTRFAEAMAAGEWDNDREVEPVMISADHNFILGGHHRLTAVTQIGRAQELRIQFYTKPKGWDVKIKAIRQAELEANANHP